MSDLLEKVGKTLRHGARRGAQAARGRWWALARNRLQRPIFVVGCSRAGTTVVYKTLSQSREIGSLQKETHDFWSTLHPLGDKGWSTHGLIAADARPGDREVVSRHFYSQTGHFRIVDKNNQNGLCVPYLHALFPDANFVYVKRSPGDNIHSLIEGWGKADEFATWSNELPADVRIDCGRYRRWCFFLFDGWRNYLDSPIEDVCAAQYIAMNRAILDARAAIAPAQWTEIVYEDLIKDPVGEFRQAFTSCGLEFGERLERHCAEVLERPYNAFSEIRLDKWRDQGNRERVERILPSVSPVAQEMGYAL